jgi:IS5 family transposase
MGVKDVSFNKKKGLKVEDKVKSTWVYKRLTKFRAGIEGNISCLKRRYGSTRCTWQGKEKFKAFVWASTVAYKLMLLALEYRYLTLLTFHYLQGHPEVPCCLKK